MSPADPAPPPWLDYRVRWRAGASPAGRHASRQAGQGGDVMACLPFWQLPDARRIDIRRSIVSPDGQVMVRQTAQRAGIAVVLAADVSRSMRPDAAGGALDAVARLAESAARSALRAGDSFAFLAFDRAVRPELGVPPRRAHGAAREVAATLARLGAAPLRGRGAQGMAELAAHLPARRCLLLLASDFLMPLDLLDRALASLARHDVAPVVLAADGAAALPRAGLLRLRDAEDGSSRLLLMRPALHRRLCHAEAARRRALDALFLRHGRPAFHAEGGLDVAALSLHLMAG